MLLHWWTADLHSPELHPASDEVAEVRWVTGEEFLQLEPNFAGNRDFVINVLPILDLGG